MQLHEKYYKREEDVIPGGDLEVCELCACYIGKYDTLEECISRAVQSYIYDKDIASYENIIEDNKYMHRVLNEIRQHENDEVYTFTISQPRRELLYLGLGYHYLTDVVDPNIESIIHNGIIRFIQENKCFKKDMYKDVKVLTNMILSNEKTSIRTLLTDYCALVTLGLNPKPGDILSILRSPAPME